MSALAVMALAAFGLPAVARAPQTEATLPERLGLRQLWDSRVVTRTTLLSLVFFFSYGLLEAATPLYNAETLSAGARGYGLL